MYHFCTITTADHMYRTLALRDSLRAVRPDACLHVLCIDALLASEMGDGVHLYSTADVAGLSPAASILTRYSSSQDRLRWSLKPVFLMYLLGNVTDRVLYTDNDVYFYDDYSFLFELLDDHDFLLTPHHYPRDPKHGQNWLEANFKVGLYNAGFIGAGKGAIPHLRWWADCCAYRCEKNVLRGTYDDQKYLDLIPVMDEKAYIIRHKGCNVADWNNGVVARSEKNGKAILDDKYPLVFIHFNGTTVRAIAEGREPCLNKSFDIYIRNLQQYKSSIQAPDLFDKKSLMGDLKYRIWKIATDRGW